VNSGELAHSEVGVLGPVIVGRVQRARIERGITMEITVSRRVLRALVAGLIGAAVVASAAAALQSREVTQQQYSAPAPGQAV
jgi:hypothetical protein